MLRFTTSAVAAVPTPADTGITPIPPLNFANESSASAASGTSPSSSAQANCVFNIWSLLVESGSAYLRTARCRDGRLADPPRPRETRRGTSVYAGAAPLIPASSGATARRISTTLSRRKETGYEHPLHEIPRRGAACCARRASGPRAARPAARRGRRQAVRVCRPSGAGRPEERSAFRRARRGCLDRRRRLEAAALPLHRRRPLLREPPPGHTGRDDAARGDLPGREP